MVFPQPSHCGTIDITGSNASQQVSSIIDWDIHFMEFGSDSLIHPQDDVPNIFEIPRKTIWPWKRNRIYYVKSGYHWLHEVLSILLLVHLTLLARRGGSLFGALTCTLPKLIKLFLSRVFTFQWGCSSLKLFRRNLLNISYSFALGWMLSIWFGSPLRIRFDQQHFTSVDIWLAAYQLQWIDKELLL